MEDYYHNFYHMHRIFSILITQKLISLSQLFFFMFCLSFLLEFSHIIRETNPNLFSNCVLTLIYSLWSLLGLSGRVRLLLGCFYGLANL